MERAGRDGEGRTERAGWIERAGGLEQAGAGWSGRDGAGRTERAECRRGLAPGRANESAAGALPRPARAAWIGRVTLPLQWAAREGASPGGRRCGHGAGPGRPRPSRGGERRAPGGAAAGSDSCASLAGPELAHPRGNIDFGGGGMASLSPLPTWGLSGQRACTWGICERELVGSSEGCLRCCLSRQEAEGSALNLQGFGSGLWNHSTGWIRLEVSHAVQSLC